ncbi:MAG: 2-C-methyl-D-erythritol 4-phosphate cytidylyltransferase [Candidatus Rokubacteria bacterium]|nr:2-C-methyl-D-erythritol 4-phosphate cytidylyltransferase [Candidatus Rokubacteria bacterium]
MSVGGAAWAVIPAGGRGLRMGQKKPGIPLGGRPVLRWTVDVFEATPIVSGVVVVVPAEDVATWQRRLRRCRKVRAVVAGGAERQESVARGLDAVPLDASWIIVHDGVRPCITPRLVTRVLAEARQHGAAVAALPIAETVKRASDGWVKETVDRDGLWAIQTPQVFRAALLREAHRHAAAEGILGTDDAALVEHLGVRVRVVPGLPGNVKITRPGDLPLVRALLGSSGRRRGAR